MDPSTQKAESPVAHLGDWLERNQRLVTVLGVFTALTVFSRGLGPPDFGQFLSTIFFSLTLLVWLELWARFPSSGGSWRLSWFENLLSFAVMTLAVYWVFSVHRWYHDLITMAVFMGTLSLVSGGIRRWNLFNRFFHTTPGKRRTLRYVVGIILIASAFALAVGAAGFIGPPVDRWIDQITAELEGPKKGA